MSQATMTTDQYLKNQWDFHAKFVKALLKQLDASPSYNTMEYKLLGARLMYATLELQISDTLLEWIDGLMDRLRESMDAFKALAKMPHKQNIDPIVAKIGQSQKCLQDFETLAKWHSVDYMSLWTHKKHILAEVSAELYPLDIFIADKITSSRSVDETLKREEKWKICIRDLKTWTRRVALRRVQLS